MSGRTMTGRRYAVGAEVQESGGVHFRVWAPKRRTVEIVFGDGSAVPLARGRGGHFEALAPRAKPGDLYRFRLDGGEAFPDPASRAQPEGPHGPSCVVDPRAFRWTDATWRGLGLPGAVFYELHVGTFTREGTWRAAAEELPHLARLGVTHVEMMPVCEFPGRFGWGYDGVDLYAPTRLYGAPDDLRAFVDRAHGLGLGVILDVVYNHIGPSGNYLTQYADEYFHADRATEWGQALNYDGPGAEAVRAFFVENAAYWIDEYHFDGLRLDATQSIHDTSEDHLLAMLGRRAREAAGGRTIVIVAENEVQEARLVRGPSAGGHGLDGIWNDDLHHAMRVALTGRREAYYTEYAGTPQELVSASKWGFLYQGQGYAWQKKRRGHPALDVPAHRFVTFLENHDQVANSATGARLHQRSNPDTYRALTALLLLAPSTPLLFQGQEYASSAPFVFFADHDGELGQLVEKGRKEFLRQFPSLADETVLAQVPAPGAPSSFERCKLDPRERERNGSALALHTDLLALRKRDPVFASQRERGVDGAVLGTSAFVLRFFGGRHGDRLVVVNLGAELPLVPPSEPLLAPPQEGRWTVAWSSDDPRYGGLGVVCPEAEDGAWRLPSRSTVVLVPSSPEAAGE
jgi:maltooligosyltrehalose trehalohydrolase